MYKICIILILLSICGLFTTGISTPARFHHPDAMLYAITQVVGGKGLLVDFFNQYGLYPVFLEPIFKIIGLNFFTFTFLMGILMVFCFFCFYVLFKNTIKNRNILFFGFCTLFIMYIMLPKIEMEAYYQYTPLRILFPSIIMALASVYFKKPSKKLYTILIFVASAGVLWNLDSGLITFLTLIITLCFNEVINYNFSNKILENAKGISKKFLKQIILALSGFALVVTVYSFYTFLCHGKFPDFSSMMSYQSIFFGEGFYMLKMQLDHPWIIHTTIYILALARGISGLFTKKNKYLSTMMILISILSIGLFTYYLGRSHEYVFLNIQYMGFILLAIFADQIWREIRLMVQRKEKPLPRIALFLSIVFIFSTSFLSIFSNEGGKSYLNKIRSNFETLDGGTNLQFSGQAQINFIVENTTPYTDVVILANNQSALYMYSKTTNPINVPGVIELFLIEDLNVIRSYLVNQIVFGETIFIDDYYRDIYGLSGILDSQYKPISESSDGQIKMYEKIT